MKKVASETGASYQVTFEVPAESHAQIAFLCGDFNNWDTQSLPMKQRKDGSFTKKMTLKSGNSYRFRYLLDGERWENAWDADAYVPNDFGSEDSVVDV